MERGQLATTPKYTIEGDIARTKVTEKGPWCLLQEDTSKADHES